MCCLLSVQSSENTDDVVSWFIRDSMMSEFFFKKGHFVRQLMGIRLKHLLSAEFRIIFSTRKIILHLFFFL